MESLLQIGRGYAHSVGSDCAGVLLGSIFLLFSVSFSDLFLGVFFQDFCFILEASGRPFCLPKSINKIIEFLEGVWRHFGSIFHRIFFNVGILSDIILVRL